MAVEQPGLWDETAREYGESELEATVRSSIDAIHAETPLTAPQRAIARICRSLAQNIDRGNAKGRAIAAEAAQLTALLNQLAGLDEDGAGTGSTVDDEIKRMMDAFAAPAAARPDTAPARHHAA